MTWEDLVRERGGDLLLYARTWCRSQADAEDILQEALMRCLATDPRTLAQPIAFLFACIRTTALDRFRSEQRRQRREEAVAGSAPTQALFACSLQGEERRLAVERALAELPDEQREVVVLKIWGTRTFDEIAAITGASINTAMSRYRYACGKLRALLSEEAS